jgi:broad specificity phosphatase PhoE
MTTDPTPSSPDPTLPEETKNFAESGENGTFGDIDPNYQLSSPQCRAIELALSGARWSQIAKTLDLNRKTLWRWKTHDDAFQRALADARADRHDFAVERSQTLAARASSVLAEFLNDPADKTACAPPSFSSRPPPASPRSSLPNPATNPLPSAGWNKPSI